MDKAGREKRNQEILESYNLGNSYFKMAETFGLSKGGVHKIIQAIKNEKPIIPQPKKETIEEVSITLQEQFYPYADDVYYPKETTVTYLVEITDNFAIGFAEWLSDNCTEIHKVGGHKGKYYLLQKAEFYTIQELLQIYKSQL